MIGKIQILPLVRQSNMDFDRESIPRLTGAISFASHTKAREEKKTNAHYSTDQVGLEIVIVEKVVLDLLKETYGNCSRKGNEYSVHAEER